LQAEENKAVELAVRGGNDYRIVLRELLRSTRHRGESEIVFASLMRDGNVRVAVRNDGATLASLSTQGRGMGIRIMKYRARMIGATVLFQPLPSGGAQVLCQFIREPKRGQILP